MFSLYRYVKFLLLPILLGFASLHAQHNDSVKLGTVYGLVKDTSLNYFLPSATVSVYMEANNKLLAYTLTNALGEYKIAGLPLGIRLKITVSYISYTTYLDYLQISNERLILNKGMVVMTRTSAVMEDVVVTPAPVRMKGDTLEFSSAAFELDKNAVAEDLLKKLPGVIIWGDGTITVNGRQISKLLVDGKPFFGGDAVVATQNIPKESIDKVQVYQEPINPFSNPFDSITSINIKLRKSSHAGYFGNTLAGLGTDGKMDLALTSFAFTPKNQFALAGQKNNINKAGNDLNTLMRNNTFKGTGAKVEYQPDFSVPGLNQQLSGGLLYSHDFIPDYNQRKANRMAFNSFVNDFRNNTLGNTSTISFLGATSALHQDAISRMNTFETKWNSDLGYVWKKNMDSFILKGNFAYLTSDKTGYNSNDISNTTLGLISHNTQDDTSENKLHSFGITGTYSHQGFVDPAIHKLSNWSATYSANGNSGLETRHLQSEIVNFQGAAIASRYDRKYHNWTNNQTHDLDFKLGDIATWLFGKNRVLSPFHIQLNSQLIFDLQSIERAVKDRDSVTNSFYSNDYLSRTSKYNTSTENLGLEVRRSFNKILANRYQKDLEFILSPQFQWYQQHFSSNKDFQNFRSDYSGFLPSVAINYTDFQYGDYFNSYALNYTVKRDYPSAEQRMALPDSSDIYMIHFGNNHIHPATNQELSFRFRHNRSDSRQPFNYGFSFNFGLIENYLADSIVVDAIGRYLYYTVNLNGNRYLGANVFFNKAFSRGSQQVQIHFSVNARNTKNPGYLNYPVNLKLGLLMSNIFTQSDTIGLSYTYKDIFAMNFQEAIALYLAQQTGNASGKYQSFQTYTRLGMGFNIGKKLSINDNINFNTFKFSSIPLRTYTIWNTSVSYRFLKGNNLELKLSALDLLHQNSGVLNYGNNYSYTHGTINMQQQYFMAGLTYFPRKFGKRKAAK